MDDNGEYPEPPRHIEETWRQLERMEPPICFKHKLKTKLYSVGYDTKLGMIAHFKCPADGHTEMYIEQAITNDTISWIENFCEGVRVCVL